MTTLSLLRQLTTVVERTVRWRLRELRLQPEDAWVLQALAEQGPQGCADLAQGSRAQRQAMQRRLEKLEQRRLVLRLPDCLTGRTVAWGLTAEGRAMRRRCGEALETCEALLRAEFKGEVPRLTRWLERVVLVLTRGEATMWARLDGGYVPPSYPETPRWDL